jgi:23S rRNA pseudouridine1911/1915/1917 synthase
MQKLLDMEVIYEDNHIIAVNKKPGELVHADDSGDITLEEKVKHYIKIRYNKPGDVYLGVLHRLDRPVSGTILFARTSKAAERMTKMIQNNEIDKTYYAIVKSRPELESGVLEHWLIKNPENNTSKAYDVEKKGSRLAILHFETAGIIHNNVLLKINPKTGRPHQIRVQLKKMGCVINGDLKYGCDFANPDKSISLHSYSAKFIHPVTKTVVNIKSEFPRNLLWEDWRAVAEAYENEDD